MILPTPEPGRHAAENFVANNLGHLISDNPVGSKAFAGGQVAADAALNRFDVTGYASRRSEVLPINRRAASRLSPYIRHGLLPLRQVWDHVADGPSRDVSKFRDELLWQEFARHRYARIDQPSARLISDATQAAASSAGDWDRDMACIDLNIDELETDGWLVNQTRMWLASQWAVRQGFPWKPGEDYFFRHLLDGSRAANGLGWQWTAGIATNKPYGFSKWQVDKRAPGLCESCALRDACPIEDWPDADATYPIHSKPSARSDRRFAELVGPSTVVRRREPSHVWLTAESLGQADPALAAHSDLPVVFVFDEPLLARLQLSGKRLVFLTETLAEIAQTWKLDLLLGPQEVLGERSVAVTHAPVPGFLARSSVIEAAEIHPWPWLVLAPKERLWFLHQLATTGLETRALGNIRLFSAGLASMHLTGLSGLDNAAHMRVSWLETGEGTLFIVFATPDSGLTTSTTQLTARFLSRTQIAVATSKCFAAIPAALAFARASEKQVSLATTQGLLCPVIGLSMGVSLFVQNVERRHRVLLGGR